MNDKNWTNTNLLFVWIVGILIGFLICFFTSDDSELSLDDLPDSTKTTMTVTTALPGADLGITVITDSIMLNGEWYFPGRDTVEVPFPKPYPVFITERDTIYRDRPQLRDAFIDSLKHAILTRTRGMYFEQPFQVTHPYALHAITAYGVAPADSINLASTYYWHEYYVDHYKPVVDSELKQAKRGKLKAIGLSLVIGAGLGMAGWELAR